MRRTTRAIALSGTEIPAESQVWLITAAASYDEDRFPGAARFDVRREGARDHLGFGRGRHFCMGAPLARLETPIALERLWARLPGFQIAPGQVFTYDPVFVTVLYNHLRVEWESVSS
jgi:cytochrome P450